MLKSLFFVLLNREAVRKNFFKLPAIGQKKKKKEKKKNKEIMPAESGRTPQQYLFKI